MRNPFGRPARDDQEIGDQIAQARRPGLFRIHHYHHTVPDAETVQFRKTVLGMLQRLLNQEDKSMSAIDDLKAEVAKNRDVSQSAVALIQGLAAKLQDAINANDPAALQQLLSDLQANDQGLADAVTANTPSADPTQPSA